MSEDAKARKAELRRWARERRAGLDWDALSEVLTERLMSLPEFAAAGRVLLYLAMADEVAVERVCGRARDKLWFVPRCNKPGRRLAVHPYVPGETPLRSGPFGIREPDGERVPEAEPATLDLVIVPALALSERGERLGYGGGYYDRFLPRLRPDCACVGVMPDALVLPTLPTDSWDRPMPVIVTESKILRAAV